MKEFVIRLSCVLDVQDFVSIATTRPFPVIVEDGQRQVNGKSFMEMFCLNCSQPLTVKVECSDESFETLRTAARRFWVES